MRIFNKSNRLFQLEANNQQLLVGPRKLLEIPEEFTRDITYRMAVQAGDIEEMGAAQIAGSEEVQQKLKDEQTARPEAKIEHPDSIEDTEQQRKAAVATGKAHPKKNP